MVCEYITYFLLYILPCIMLLDAQNDSSKLVILTLSLCNTQNVDALKFFKVQVMVGIFPSTVLPDLDMSEEIHLHVGTILQRSDLLNYTQAEC